MITSTNILFLRQCSFSSILFRWKRKPHRNVIDKTHFKWELAISVVKIPSSNIQRDLMRIEIERNCWKLFQRPKKWRICVTNWLEVCLPMIPIRVNVEIITSQAVSGNFMHLLFNLGIAVNIARGKWCFMGRVQAFGWFSASKSKPTVGTI